jgi:polyhydroxyalkanoate synthesis regulator phasin
MIELLRSRGNAIQEYGVVAFLGVAACVSVLLALGGQINTLMADLKQDMSAHRDAAAHAEAMVPGKLPAVEQEQPSAPALTGLTPEETLMLQSNLSSKLQTLGANGTTELLAKQLEALAQSLLAKGEITEAQFRTLQQLANKGHDMAQVEGMLEDYVEMASGKQSQFSDMKLQFQGQSYTPLALSKLIGINRTQPETITDFFSDTSGTGTLLSDFQSLYLSAEQNGSLDNPEVKALVTAAASQIVITGELMEHSYYKFHDGTDSNVSAFTDRLLSKATQVRSWEICKSGNGNDDGTFCQ